MHATAPVAVVTWLSCDRNSAGPRKPICAFRPKVMSVLWRAHAFNSSTQGWISSQGASLFAP